MAVIVEELEDQEPSSPEEQGTGEGAGEGAGEREADGAEGGAPTGAGEGGGEAGPSVAGSLEAAEELKAEGNAAYKRGDMEEAKAKYSRALEVCPDGEATRAVYLANRAACHLSTEDLEQCIEDCTQALAVDGKYVKVLLRRSTAYEKQDQLDKALQDAKAAKEADPGNRQAAEAVARLEPEVSRRLEAQKEEMMGQLKDLGNTVLGKFGLSLDNFKATKDPQTGSYSINFQQ